MAHRVDNYGLLINREDAITMSFDGKPVAGFAGDCVASALLANDQLLMGRSFKYHRPRGVLSSGHDEPNALIGTGEGAEFEPNNRASVTPAVDGLATISQNKWPSLGFDIGAINAKLSRFFPAGFYYKTFTFPRFAWKHLYEPFIRQSAGLGKSTVPGDPSRYEHFYAHFDVVVAGGGIAGVLATEQAANAGLNVLLAEQNPYWGGRVLVDGDVIDDLSAPDWFHDKIKALSAMDNVTLRTNMQVSGSYDHGYLLATETPASGPRTRLWRIRAGHLIGATGAIERPIAFANNDLPGVMLASSMRDYLALYGVAVGERVVVVTNNDDAYRTAVGLAKAGVEVPAIIDVRDAADAPIIAPAREMGIRVAHAMAISSVKGKKRVEAVDVCFQRGDGEVVETIACDAVAVSGGWSPVVHLYSHSGGKLNWIEDEAHFAPDPERAPRDQNGDAMVTMAGMAAGAMTTKEVAASALDAAIGVAKSAKKRVSKLKVKIAEETRTPIRPVWMMPEHASYNLRSKAFLDFQNDVKVSDIQLAAQEGFHSVEHAKRYTTLGMATDQGKTSNINGLAILADALNSPIPEVGTTTFRPPYTPIPMGAIAGHHTGELFKALRKSPIHEWHEENGVEWEPVGDWRRPFVYKNKGESTHDAVQRETKNTRENVGLLDASTLGKILVEGPDAGKFLDLMYTNIMSTLKIGACRYGLMTNENGFVYDDGVVARTGENSFICHTTSGGSDHVHAVMEEWLQTEWWDLKVYTANITEHYGQIAVVGPKARRILEVLGGMDVSPEALPFMRYADGVLGGFDARVFRISFSGELSYEIAVRADQTRALWDRIVEIGAEYGMMPYGTETLHILRAEKGFIIVGDETDGTVTPLDLGMSWIVSKKKEDFLGKRGLERPLFHSPERRHLVGVLTDDPDTVLPHAAHAIEGKRKDGLDKTIGYVTSTYFSPNLGRSIAMALIENGRERTGEVLTFKTADGRDIKAVVTDVVFFDKDGEKQNVE